MRFIFDQIIRTVFNSYDDDEERGLTDYQRGTIDNESIAHCHLKPSSTAIEI